MADQLSLPNLLSLLHIEQQQDAVDQEIFRLCREAEGLRRRHLYKAAIERAECAAQIAREKSNWHLHTVALLYLSVSRSSSNARDRKQAIQDCDEAIGLSIDFYDRAFAELVRAQIELIAQGKDNNDSAAFQSKQRAIVHFQRACEALMELVAGKGISRDLQQADYYLNFVRIVNSHIEELVTSMLQASVSLRKPKQKLSKTTTQPTTPSNVTANRSAPPIDLPVPTRLVWPGPNTSGPWVPPVFGSYSVDPSRGRVKAGDSPLDYIEVNQFSIEGRLYAVHPEACSPNSGNPLRLYQGKQYIAIEINGNGEQGYHSDQYVLVRRQDSLDHPGQKVVVTIPSIRRIWVTQKKLPPRFVGDSERQWDFIDDPETATLGNKKPRIIGVVEAILTPISG